MPDTSRLASLVLMNSNRKYPNLIDLKITCAHNRLSKPNNLKFPFITFNCLLNMSWSSIISQTTSKLINSSFTSSEINHERFFSFRSLKNAESFHNLSGFTF